MYFACGVCDKRFFLAKYRYDVVVAELARTNHQNSHPSEGEADEEDEEQFLLESEADEDANEEEGKLYEEAILLGVTVVNTKFCLVAWLCDEGILFRHLSPDGFWSREQLDRLNIPQFSRLRFRRDPNQFCNEWPRNGPHRRDNIRICDASAMAGPANTVPLPDFTQSIQSRLRLDADLKATSPCNNPNSSFALGLVRNLEFFRKGQGLRCRFVDCVSNDQLECPVVNKRMRKSARFKIPRVSQEDEHLVVLGLSREHEGRFQLLFDALLPDNLGA